MKSTLVFVFCFILALPPTSSAQFSPGARQIAQAHSSLATPDDVFSVFQNPAGNALLRWREIGIYYSPSPFGMTELANAYGAYVEPFSFGTVGIGFMKYGFELFSENKITLSLGTKIAENFYAGLSGDMNFLKIASYGNSSALTVNLGGLYLVRTDTRIAFRVGNLLRTSYSGTENQLPVDLSLGLSYDPAENATVNLAVVKNLDFPLSVCGGIEYSIIRYLDIRLGVQTEPAAFTGGVGINYSYFQFDYAVLNHNELGITHQAGLIVHFTEFISRRSAVRNKHYDQ